MVIYLRSGPVIYARPSSLFETSRVPFLLSFVGARLFRVLREASHPRRSRPRLTFWWVLSTSTLRLVRSLKSSSPDVGLLPCTFLSGFLRRARLYSA